MRHIIPFAAKRGRGLKPVAGLFSTRGYNIDRCRSRRRIRGVSRITLVTEGSDAVIQQILSQLNKLVDVVSAET